jgi:hypothetical protein
MQLAITFMAVVGGLVFSVAVALVVEELIFGQVFRIFFNARGDATAGFGKFGATAGQDQVTSNIEKERLWFC